MKILFISMPSVHVIRWVENLKDSEHELFWFDVLGKGKLQTIDSVQQFTNWKNRKLPYLKGEHFLSKKFPKVYDKWNSWVEVTANQALEKIVLETDSPYLAPVPHRGKRNESSYLDLVVG